MINGIFKVFIFAITALLALGLVKNVKSSLSLFLSISAVILIAFFSVTQIMPIIDFIKKIAEFVDIDEEYLKIIIKCLGISVLCELTCHLCQDSGESALSQGVAFAAKVSILTIALPMYKEIFEMVLNLWESG